MVLISCAPTQHTMQSLRVVGERSKTSLSRKARNQHFAFSFKIEAFPTVKNSAFLFPFSLLFSFGPYILLAWISG